MLERDTRSLYEILDFVERNFYTKFSENGEYIVTEEVRVRVNTGVKAFVTAFIAAERAYRSHHGLNGNQEQLHVSDCPVALYVLSGCGSDTDILMAIIRQPSWPRNPS